MLVIIIFLSLTIYIFNLLDRFVNEILSKHNVLWKIRIINNISIDMYGAIIPVIISIFLAFYLVYARKFPFKRYLILLLLTYSFALLLSRGTSTAIIIYYKALALTIGFICVSVTINLIQFLKFLKSNVLNLGKTAYFNALLMSYSFSSLSSLFVDLTYLPLTLPFTSDAYIGGSGLADGIMISGLTSLICVSMVLLVIMLIKEITEAILVVLSRL